MFYLNEFYFRLIYIIFSFFISFIICYYIEDYFFSFLLFGNNLFYNKGFETAFVLTSPVEVLEVNFYLCLLISNLGLVPIILFNMYSFFFSSLKKLEIKIVKKILFVYVTQFYFFNTLLIVYLFPFFWYWLEYFNFIILQFSNVNLEYEPNFVVYLKSLYTLIFYFNFFFSIFYFTSFFYKKQSISFYFKYYKIGSFFLIFCFSLTIFFFENYYIFMLPFLFYLLKYYFKYVILFNNFNILIIKNSICKLKHV